MKPLQLDLYHAAHLSALLDLAANSDGDKKEITAYEKQWLERRFNALETCGKNFDCFIKDKKEQIAFKEYHRQIVPLLKSMSPNQLSELSFKLHPASSWKVTEPFRKQFDWWTRMEKSLEGFNGPIEPCKLSKQTCLEASAKIFVSIEVNNDSVMVNF